MKRIVLAAALAAGFATSAAAADPFAIAYGNTVISTGGMAEVHTHYRADHTFDMTATAVMFNKTYQGSWALDGKGNLCRTFVGESPPNTANPLCTPIAAHKVGETWTATANGSTRTVTLKPGIE